MVIAPVVWERNPAPWERHQPNSAVLGSGSWECSGSAGSLSIREAQAVIEAGTAGVHDGADAHRPASAETRADTHRRLVDDCLRILGGRPQPVMAHRERTSRTRSGSCNGSPK